MTCFVRMSSLSEKFHLFVSFSMARLSLAFLQLAVGTGATDEVFNVTFANELTDGTIGRMRWNFEVRRHENGIFLFRLTKCFFGHAHSAWKAP